MAIPPDDSRERDLPTLDSDAGSPTADEPLAGINDMVREIRQRLTDIGSRELEIRRREQEFERQYRRLEQTARESVSREVDEDRRRYERQQAALREREAELTGRSRLLDERDRELRERAQQAERQHDTVVERAALIQERIQTQQLRLSRQREALRKRIGVVRTQEEELARRVLLARGEITGQRSGLERQQTELQVRAARLAEAEKQLAQRQAEADRRLRESEQVAADTQQTRKQLLADQQRIEQERRENERAARELADQREAVTQRQQEYDERWQATHGQQQDIARQQAELESRRRLLEQQYAELEERAQRLEHREQQLQARVDKLEAERRSADEARTEVARLRRDMETLREQAVALQEQATLRDTETRQAALALEVQRQSIQTDLTRLQKERATLAATAEALTEQRAQGEQGIEQARQELAALTDKVRRASRVQGGRPRGWVLRTVGLSIVLGVIAAGAWLLLSPGRYQASTEIRIVGEGAAAGAVVTEHRSSLLDPDLFNRDADPALVRAWRTACAEGRVAVSTTASDADSVTLRLTLSGRDVSAARYLVQAAAATYAERINNATTSDYLPRPYEALATLREQLAGERQTTQAAQSRDALGLATCPSVDERDQGLADAERFERQLRDASGALQERRSTLAALLSAELPHGTIDPADVDAALVQDTICQEDRAEFHAVALKYRSELAISMMLLIDPAKNLLRAVEQALASVAEQRQLTPPPEIAAVLEACDTELQGAQERLTKFLDRWQNAVEVVQTLSVDDDVVKLVERQNAVADEARREADDAVHLVDALGARLEALNVSGEGSTREVVVGAVLRSDHGALKTAVEAFLGAAGKTALTENFELDTQDRQLRGLRMRLSQRREALEQRMQAEADRVARQEHNARIDGLRDDIQRLEQQREEALAGLSTALKSQRTYDEAMRRRTELEARSAQQEARIAWLTTRMDELDRTLAAARRSGLQPDRLEVGAVSSEPLDTRRYAYAGLAGGGAFALTWLASLVAVAGSRRGQREIAQVAARVTPPKSPSGS